MAGARLLSLSVVIIMAFICFGCGRSFDTSRGLSIHRRYCASLKQGVSLSKRGADEPLTGPSKMPRLTMPGNATGAEGDLAQPQASLRPQVSSRGLYPVQNLKSR